MNFDHFLIRPILPSDVAGFYGLIEKNRSRLENYFPTTLSKNKNIHETTFFIPEVITKSINKVYYSFLIIDLNTDKPIRYLDIKNINWKIPKGEVGYFIDDDYKRKGIMSKALKMLISYCFDHLGFIKLSARIQNDNVASKIVAEKNGFELEGVIRRDHLKYNGEVVDLNYYGLLKQL